MKCPNCNQPLDSGGHTDTCLRPVLNGSAPTTILGVLKRIALLEQRVYGEVALPPVALAPAPTAPAEPVASAPLP